jgi:hypothetical protein
MILVWNDAGSFRRHVEAMKTFRHSHHAYPVDGLLLRDMPATSEINPSHGEKMITRLTDSRGKVIFVPIWKIPVTPGSQN